MTQDQNDFQAGLMPSATARRVLNPMAVRIAHAGTPLEHGEFSMALQLQPASTEFIRTAMACDERDTGELVIEIPCEDMLEAAYGRPGAQGLTGPVLSERYIAQLGEPSEDGNCDLVLTPKSGGHDPIVVDRIAKSSVGDLVRLSSMVGNKWLYEQRTTMTPEMIQGSLVRGIVVCDTSLARAQGKEDKSLIRLDFAMDLRAKLPALPTGASVYAERTPQVNTLITDTGINYLPYLCLSDSGSLAIRPEDSLGHQRLVGFMTGEEMDQMMASISTQAEAFAESNPERERQRR